MKYSCFLNGNDINSSGIYSIENIDNGKIYIGSAVNFRKRWNSHSHSLCSNTHYNIYLQRAWNKYGADNFIFSIIEIAAPESLLIREQFYLDNFKDQKDKLYNVAITAGSIRGLKFNETCRKNISEKRKAFFQSPNGILAREKLRKSATARMNGTESENIKHKIREKTILNVKSSAGRKKNSDGQHRRYQNRESLEKARDAAGCRWIICEQTGQKFHGTIEAERAIGVDRTMIYSVCKGKFSQASGFTFRFCDKDEIVSQLKPKIEKKPRTKGTKVQCIETGEIFENCSEACRKLGISNSSIFKVLNGSWNQTNGFTFKKL